MTLSEAHARLQNDEDQVAQGESGDGPDLGTIELDVDVDQQFIRFDDRELTEQLQRRVASRPGLHRTPDRLGRALTTY